MPHLISVQIAQNLDESVRRDFAHRCAVADDAVQMLRAVHNFAQLFAARRNDQLVRRNAAIVVLLDNEMEIGVQFVVDQMGQTLSDWRIRGLFGCVFGHAGGKTAAIAKR